MVEQTAPLSVEDKEYWDVLYRTGRTPWELSTFAPPLKTFLDSPYAVPRGRVAVLGSGSGQDALLFARYGFEVVAIDFSPTAVAATQKLFEDAGFLNRTAWVMERNIFDLHDCDQQFDYILENTCFCAIHPSRRNQYAFVAKDLLKPNGKVIALFWTLDRKGSGPPYPVNSNEIFDCFKQSFSFDIVHIPPDSIPKRAGKELFVLMSLKNSTD